MTRTLMILIMLLASTLVGMMIWANAAVAFETSYPTPLKNPLKIEKTYPATGGDSQPTGSYPTPVRNPLKIDKTYPATGDTNNSNTVIQRARSRRR